MHSSLASKLYVSAEVLVGGNAWDAPEGSGKRANLKNPSGVVVDLGGNVFIADTENDRILKRATNSVVTVHASHISLPFGLALEQSGVLWVRTLNDLWKVLLSGEKVMVLSSSSCGGDEASQVALPGWSVSAIAVDKADTLYFTDWRRHQVFKMTLEGEPMLIAGSGVPGYADGPADLAKFNRPVGIAVAGDGTIFVSDFNHRIRRITPDGQVSRFAGTYRGYKDGPIASAEFNHPQGLVLHPDGSLFVSCPSSEATRVICPDGQVRTIAAVYGKGETRQETTLNSDALALGSDGALYVASRSEAAIIRATCLSTGEMGPSKPALPEPIRGGSPPIKSIVTTLAGTGEPGWDNGPPEVARFYGPTGIVSDHSGIFVTDTRNHRIRRIAVDGSVSTVAGTHYGFEDGAAMVASFAFPEGIASCNSGDLIIADTRNNRIRLLTKSSMVRTLAGRKNWDMLVFHVDEGTTGVVQPDEEEITQPMGDPLKWIDFADGEGTHAKFNQPMGLVCDGIGNVLIVDHSNGSIRKLAPDGKVTTLSLRRSAKNLSDRWGQEIPDGSLAMPVGIAIGRNGDLYISEAGLSQISRISTDGEISALAGGKKGFEDGLGSAAAFDDPAGLAVDADGNLFVADTGNHRIRRVTPDGMVDTIAGGVSGYVDGTWDVARFNEPWGLAFHIDGSLLVTDRKNHAVRKISMVEVDEAQTKTETPPGDLEKIIIYSHDRGGVIKGMMDMTTPRLIHWEQCVGRRIRIITADRETDSIRMYFEDAWIEIEGVGDDPMPYFKDDLEHHAFHADGSHLIGKVIRRLEVTYREQGGTCEHLAFAFDGGLRQWLEPACGSGLRIS